MKWMRNIGIWGQTVAVYLWMAAGGIVYAQSIPTTWGVSSGYAVTTIPTNAMSGVTAIGVGDYHSLAVRNAGVIAWGNNASNQCVVPSAASNSVSKVAGGYAFSLALRTDGRVVAWGSGPVTNVPTSAQSGVTAIAAGKTHALALKDGGVIAWGDANYNYGQTNVPSELSSGVTAISAGDRFSMALKNGRVYVWGDNRPNDLGYYDMTNVPVAAQSGVTAIAAGPWHALALKDGGVIHWGSTNYNSAVIPVEAQSGVTDIAAGYCTGMAMKNGGVIVWGGNNIGTDAPTNVPPAARSQVASMKIGYGHCLTLGSQMAPRILTTSLPGGIVDAAYSAAVVAEGVPSVTYLKGGGTNWPSWLVLDASSGMLSGTPLVATNKVTVTILASNTMGVATSTYTFAVTVRPVQPPVWVTTSVPDGEVDLYYSFQLSATEATSYYLTGPNALPEGLYLSPGGLLSGTPEAEVSMAQFQVVASNIAGRATNTFSITVQPPRLPPPVWVTTSPLPSGKQGMTYSIQLSAENSPTHFALSSGFLPTGVTLNSAGLLGGTPTDYGVFSFTIRASNESGDADRSFQWTVVQTFDPPVFITTSPLPSGWVGDAYSQIITAENGIITYTLDSGAIPPGLTLETDGTLSGTPQASGDYVFDVRATNPDAYSTQEYRLDIFAYEEPWITGITSSDLDVILSWTNPNPSHTSIRVIADPAVTNLLSPTATDMGVQTSPWTNTVTTNYMMYRLKLDR